jgi:hypothetical protein
MTDRFDIENLNVREEYSHEGPNFLGATLTLDGEPLLNLRGTGLGAVMIEPTDDGKMDTDTVEDVTGRTASSFVTDFVLEETGYA